jgi:methanogenic corrinoid protein MtbC1
MAKELVNAIADLQEAPALENVRRRLQAGEEPLTILNDVREATDIVGKRFASGEYYIPDLIFSGEILKAINALIKPKMAKVEVKKIGKVIIGTVAGDIHNIGKDILIFMLEANGFEVFDLGIDVPAEKFVQKIKETGAPVVGLSGLLTVVYDAMKQTVGAIAAAGLRDKVKIMIGGGMTNEDTRKYTGADAFGRDAMDGVLLARKWIGGK